MASIERIYRTQSLDKSSSSFGFLRAALAPSVRVGMNTQLDGLVLTGAPKPVAWPRSGPLVWTKPPRVWVP